MNRVLLAAVAGLVLVPAARADIPPPKGQKRVAVDHKIETDKEYPDYAFFTLVGFKDLKAVKLGPKDPVVIGGAGRFGPAGQATLIAVPKDAAKAYPTEKEFHEAVRTGKVPGMLQSKASLGSLAVVKDTDKRTVITRTHKLEKLDPKEGVVLTPVRAAGDGGEEEEEAAAPGAGRYVWAAGVAATLAVALTGLWLVRRRRPVVSV
jgi:hypothetical protein